VASRWTHRILALDPVGDHAEIYRISAGHEFPWDYQRALELALLRTYCVPSISALLEATGEFRDRPQRRYDDTALLMAELAAHGYDSARGREALRVINRAHGRYAISNDDMLYVLSGGLPPVGPRRTAPARRPRPVLAAQCRSRPEPVTRRRAPKGEPPAPRALLG
jgi:hypothetical protein